MNLRYIDIDLFHQRIFLTSEDDANKYCEDIDLSLYEALAYIGYRKRISFYTTTNRDDVLVHESIHLANFIIDRCGLYSTPQYDETLAYLTQYIYKKLKKKLIGEKNVSKQYDNKIRQKKLPPTQR